MYKFTEGIGMGKWLIGVVKLLLLSGIIFCWCIVFAPIVLMGGTVAYQALAGLISWMLEARLWQVLFMMWGM